MFLPISLIKYIPARYSQSINHKTVRSKPRPTNKSHCHKSISDPYLLKHYDANNTLTNSRATNLQLPAASRVRASTDRWLVVNRSMKPFTAKKSRVLGHSMICQIRPNRDDVPACIERTKPAYN